MFFWVFLVHPTVVSVLLSASVEKCFVSRMRDFFKCHYLSCVTLVSCVANVGVMVFQLPCRAIFGVFSAEDEQNQNWFWCYYPHRSRYALSPVCGIFLY